jgi:hypothetical protein
MKVKQVLFGDQYQWERAGYKERMKEDEYDGNMLHSCTKMEK